MVMAASLTGMRMNRCSLCMISKYCVKLKSTMFVQQKTIYIYDNSYKLVSVRYRKHVLNGVMGSLGFLIIQMCLVALVCCVHDAAEITLDADELGQWLKRFTDDPFFKQETTSHPQTSEEASCIDDRRDVFDVMKDELEQFLTDVFHSKIQSFPANEIVVQAMYRLLSPNGVLKKEGFTPWGNIKRDGQGMIIWTRAFTNEQELLEMLNNSTGLHLTSLQVAIGDMDAKKQLVAVANYILTLQDLKRLKKWLAEKYKKDGELVRHSIHGNRTIVIVEYYCCSQTNNRLLKPYYGTIKVKVG